MVQRDYNELQVARLVIKGTAVLCRNAEDLHIEIFLHGEVVVFGRRTTAELALEQ